MIAHLEQLGQELVAIAQEHPDDMLAVLEQEVLAAVRRVKPRLLEDVIAGSVSSQQPASAPRRLCCPTCGRRVRQQSWRERQVKTVCGPIHFQRPWYVCSHCQHGFSPTDQALGLLPRVRLSEGMERWVVEMGVRADFRDAAAGIAQLTGLEVAAETVRQHTEKCGAALEAADQRAQEQVVRTQEAAEAVEATPGELVVEADGVLIRYQDGWREVKLGVVGGQVEGELRGMSYVAARETAEEFGPRLLAEAARRGVLEVVAWEGPVLGHGLAQLRPVTVVGDGAVWIWNLAADYFGERTEVVDFYHAAQHVWEVGKALLGEGSEACREWAQTRLKELRHEGVGPVLSALAAAKADTAEGAEVLRRERGYFRTNAARMAYPDFAAAGLPLGSGAVESSARHLVQLRMKLPGARWSTQGGQAVLAVRCRLLSHRPLPLRRPLAS